MNEKIDNIIQDLLENNLQWSIISDYKIPIEIKNNGNKRKITSAQIHLLDNDYYEASLIISDDRFGRTFSSKWTPEKINIHESSLENENKLKQILLHELNHWYVFELFGENVQSHGKEFKKCGKINGLHKNYNCAKIKNDIKIPEGYYIKRGHLVEKGYDIRHVGVCSVCGELVCSRKTKKEITDIRKNYHTNCCSGKIKYDGVYKIKID